MEGRMSMIIIRDAKKEDLLNVAKVKIDTWRTAYGRIVSDEILNNFDLDEQAKKLGELIEQCDGKKFLAVAEASGEVVGFAAGGSERDGKHGIDGEVYAIYVFKEHQNQGIGKKLMEYSAKKLEGMGFNSMLVWVLEENRYKRFYEKHGGIQIDKKSLEIGGEDHFIVAYAWREMRDFQ
ncbi:MAG: GNAT family N-acetyltransferase [Bacillota bacterium]|nr:GNAT family N-acetyltransferase [Bacillota bacterium]